MISNFLYGKRPVNSLPPLEHILTKPIQDWIGWSTIYFKDAQDDFSGIWIQVRTMFRLCRGNVVRAYVSSLKSGDGVRLRQGNCYGRNDDICRYIGRRLWEQVAAARNRPIGNDFSMTRAEVAYCAAFPSANLVGLELHHVNRGPAHQKWKAAVENCLAPFADQHGVASYRFTSALDDRPRNLLAMTKKEHYQWHLRNGGDWYGNYQELGCPDTAYTVRTADVSTARDATKPRLLTGTHNNLTHYGNRGLYDRRRRRFLTVVGRTYYRGVIVSNLDRRLIA